MLARGENPEIVEILLCLYLSDVNRTVSVHPRRDSIKFKLLPQPFNLRIGLSTFWLRALVVRGM